MQDNQGYEIDQILQEMRSDYWRTLEAVEEDGGGTKAEYLIIRCGNNRYGLLAASCREVLKLPHLVRVPRLPEHLRGIFNLRGEIVAVTDICPLLGQSGQTVHESFRLVIVEEGAIKTALLVEVVEGLIEVSEEQIEPLAEGAGAGARDLFFGKVVQGEEALVLLSLDKLLGRPELIVDQKEQAEGKR
ncbi:MAG: chemotaxis protein CheW [Desulfuromonadales bacterium]|nr:chemotaxis protein CheW [Desulfuromonadales bacterium]